MTSPWRQIGAVDHDGVHCTFWQHPTGATHLHRHTDDPDLGFGMSFRTPAVDDSGLPHAVEHLIGTGSRKFPMSSALLTAAYRSCSGFMNGLSETGRTSYAFTAGDPHDYADLLDVLLDGLYHPLLRRRDFLREACRATAGADGSSAQWRGIVHSELALKSEPPAQWFTRLAVRRFRPDDPAQYRHEGTPGGLPALEYESCAAFHETYYRPEGAHSFASSPDAEPTLTALAAAHADRSGTIKQHGMPPHRKALLHGPVRTEPRYWAAVQVVISDSDRAGWTEAAALAAALTADRRSRDFHWTISTPAPFGAGVVLYVGSPADGVDTAQASEQLRGLEATIRDVQANRTLSEDNSPLELLGAPYRTMPPSISWGLALAGPRMAGHAPLTLLGPRGSGRTPPSRMDLGIVTDAGLPGNDPGEPTRTRIRKDATVWRSRPGSQDASGLPLRPLIARSIPTQPVVEQTAPGLELLPLDGQSRTLTHVLLTVESASAFLIDPLVRFLRTAARKIPVPTCMPRPPLLTRTAIVRGAAATVDLLFDGWSPHFWTALLTTIIDTPTVRDALVAEITRTLRRRSFTLMTETHELADSAAVARVSPVGAAQDAVTGMPAMARWQSLTAAESTDDSMTALTAALRQLADAEVRLLIVGPRASSTHVRWADDRPAWTARPSPPMPPVCVEFANSHRWHAHATAWPIAADIDAATAAVLGADLRRRYIHPLVREEGGAYTAYAGFDSTRSALVVYTGADPCNATRRRQLQLLPESTYHPPDDDALETARLMVVRRYRLDSSDLPLAVSHALSAPHRPPGATDLATVTAADLEHLAESSLSAQQCESVSL
ncbi:hypothetical protein ACIBCN_37315 [Nocardia sp. NPDC051052]|uniref:hypothetical protein n=1 Tax=Nocardia sp. NPDC051052 TaxID=3364322 RepID=UPI0037B66B62